MSDRVVVDASVVVKWVIPEDYTEDALRLRDHFLDGEVEVHAPSIILLEVASALRKYYVRGLVSRDVIERALELIAKSGIKLHEVDLEMALNSLRTSLNYDVTIYDAAYIALTLILDATMYTADDKLLNNPKIPRLKVRHVKEYRKP